MGQGLSQYKATLPATCISWQKIQQCLPCNHGGRKDKEHSELTQSCSCLRRLLQAANYWGLCLLLSLLLLPVPGSEKEDGNEAEKREGLLLPSYLHAPSAIPCPCCCFLTSELGTSPLVLGGLVRVLGTLPALGFSLLF